MVYTVTLMNPLASGSDGTWHLDLLMEAVVGETPAEPLSPANGSPAPPCNAGSGAAAATADGGGGGEPSAGRANSPLLPPVDDVSDDDDEGDDERQKREGDGDGAGSGGAGGRGGALPQDGRAGGAGGAGSGGDGAGGGGVLPGDGRAGVEGGERGAVDDVLEISDDSLDESADDGGTDNEEGDEEQGSDALRQGNGVNPPAALETETETGTAGFDDEQISSDGVSSEDEPIGRAGKGSQPEKRALQAPPAEENDRASGTRVEMPSPATPPRPSPPSSAMAASSARSPLDKYRSPDSFASQTPESRNEDDSSFDEAERGSGDSSDADMDYDSDGYEVDVPFPPCSVMHKERRTYKQSLCKECFETYTRDLQRAGVRRSDVDSDSGRTIKRKRTRSRRRRQPRERAASSVRKEGMVDRRSRRLRRESRESNTSPNSDRQERRKNRSAVAASARLGETSQQDKIPKKKTPGDKNGKVNFPRMKRRLSKEGGMQALKYSSPEAADLHDSSENGSDGSGKGKKGNVGAQRDKPRGGDRTKKAGKPPRAVKPSAVGKTVIDIAHTDSSEDDSAPAAAPATGAAPARLGSKKRSSKQDTAGTAATNSRGRGSDAFLGALMGGPPLQRATSVDSSFPPDQGSHPKLKKRPSVGSLQGRANTAEGSSFSGHDRLQLKRAESFDTATSRRDGLPSNGCVSSRPESAPGQDTRPLRPIPELSSSQSEHRSTVGSTLGASSAKQSEKRGRAELTDSRRPKAAKKARPAEKEDAPAPIPKKPAYAKVPHFTGVVRKVSNGKFFLWVHDKLHDGKPYDSAEVCAKEYDKLTRSSRGSQRGPRRNFGDSRAPSHAEIPGLTQLSLGTDGGSRIAKKCLTSAYNKGQPAPAPANKATKNSFFAPKERPLTAPRQPPKPPRPGPLRAPPIVASYESLCRVIDPPMRSRTNGAGGSTHEGQNEGQPALAYPSAHTISWAVTTETFRPADGLHVPGGVGGLPHRSGLVGGRQGRPAPDTRLSCAETGNSRKEYERLPIEGDPEDPYSDDEASEPGLSPASAADKNASTAAAKAAPSTPTPDVPGAMPMPHTGSVTPAVPTPPQQPLAPTAAQVNAPVSSLLAEASSSAQGPANGSDRDRAKLSVAAAAPRPPPNVPNGGGVLPASGLGEAGGAAAAVGGKHGPKETTGTGVEAGEGDGRAGEHEADGTRLHNGGGASTAAASPVTASVLLSDRLAQVRGKAEVRTMETTGAEAGEGGGRAVEHEADGTRLHNGGRASTAAAPVTSSVLLSDRLAQVRGEAEVRTKETTGAEAGVEAGEGGGRVVEHEAGGTRLHNGGGASTAAAPVNPSLLLSDRLAQARGKAEDSPREAGSSPSQQQQPTEEAEENRDEEDGREFLQSMMNGGPVDDTDDAPADDEMGLGSEEGAEDAVVMERPYPADAAQLSDSEESAEHSDAVQSAYCTQEQDAEEDENVDGKSEPPGFEKFLADFRSSRQVPPVVPPAAAPLTAGTTVGDGPVPLPLSSAAAAGEVNGGVRYAAPTMPTLPPAPDAQVDWSTPLEVSRRVNTNKAPVGDTVSPRTAWVQPRRLGGSANAGVSTAAPCATTPLPPGEELKPRAENVAARQSLSGAHEIPAPSDEPLLPNETVAKVAWRAPCRLAPIVANAIRPAVRFDRKPEGQGDGVPPGVLQVPPEAAELLSETTKSGAADGAVLEMPRAPLGPPDLLASLPPSRTQGLVPPSTSVSPARPCEEKEDVVGAEQALPLSGSLEQSPDGLGDEMPNGQIIDLKLKAMILARANAREVDPAATTKPAGESVPGDKREANGHAQSNGHGQAHEEANGHSQSNGQDQAHDGRRLVVEEKAAASCSSRGGSRPALDANPRGFSRYAASPSPSRHRSRSDSPKQSSRGSSSSSGIRERRRYGDDDRPRSRDRPRQSTGDSSSGGSSTRQRRRYDGRDDHDRPPSHDNHGHDRPRSRDDGHHRRRYEDFGRSGSRGSSDSSGRSRREDSRYYPRDEFGRGGWRDEDYDNNRVRRGGFDSSLRSPRDDGRYHDSKRLRRKRSLSPQRDWRR